jgi:hypothetical protein
MHFEYCPGALRILVLHRSQHFLPGAGDILFKTASNNQLQIASLQAGSRKIQKS